MTEIEKQAEEYARELIDNLSVADPDFYDIKKSYLDGFEAGQKEKFINEYLNKKVAELEDKIDKMIKDVKELGLINTYTSRFTLLNLVRMWQAKKEDYLLYYNELT